MIYGLFQFYHDELNSWRRTIAFHKEELHESIRQISVLMGQQVISSENEKQSASLTDQFVVQEQQFDHVANQIIAQKQRLERTGFFQGKRLEPSVSQAQDSIRLKIRNAERKFARTKYSCTLYLSSFLRDGSLAVQN